MFFFSNYHISYKEQKFYNQEKNKLFIILTYLVLIVLTINSIPVLPFVRCGVHPALSPSFFHISASDNVKSDHS